MITITAILKRKGSIRFSQLRYLAQITIQKQKENTDGKMQAWQIHSYGGLDELKLTRAKIPILTNPTDVLIKVDAASINPIDIAMINGYGATILNFLRKVKSCESKPYSDIEFPITTGRDFAGTVISKGHGVDKLNVGNEVWGVVPLEQQGCHAEYVMVDSSLVNLKPTNLTCIEAASILYAGLTAWSALWYSGGLCLTTAIQTQRNKKMLVLGCSGGVGTIAIQLLKAWNMHVVATGSSDAEEMLQNLGADVVIDYTDDKADSKIISEGPYHIILDCCGQGPEIVRQKGYPHCIYVTLNAPLVKNMDAHGLVFGTIRNFAEILRQNIPSKDHQSLVKWGFFIPSPTGLNMIQELVESKKLIPVVQEVYSFDDLPKAYQKLNEGHTRGKIVIDMKQED